MTARIRIRYFLPVLLILLCTASIAQTLPLGIHYQAVARDNYGRELSEKEIFVLFSIISESPLGNVEYKELHENVRTSKYGVFSLIIGNGKRVEGTVSDFSQIAWELSDHYLKVEVKFEDDYIDMGTMQFLAVPYALYAKKSLEPGPPGPKGDTGPQGLKGETGAKGEQGDPATDDQYLSFDGTNLTISGGNTLNLSTLNIPHQLSILGDTLSIMGGNKIGLPNQIQDLTLDLNNKLKITKNPAASEIDLGAFKQNLSYNNSTGILSISNGTGVDLTPIKNDAIQDLSIDLNNKLKITKNAAATEIDLNKYMDNTDNQAISYDSSTFKLSIANGNTVQLGRIIAFRSKKLLSTVASSLTDVPYIPSTVEYNVGNAFNPINGEFVAPCNGIYNFNITYYADGSGGSRTLSIYYNSGKYEDLAVEIASGSQITTRSITMKLNYNDIVKLIINTGTSTQTGTGSFSGFRIY